MAKRASSRPWSRMARTIADADAADAVVLECNITEFKSGGLMPPYIIVDVTLSSRSDEYKRNVHQGN